MSGKEPDDGLEVLSCEELEAILRELQDMRLEVRSIREQYARETS
jgi:hypothetical protein